MLCRSPKTFIAGDSRRILVPCGYCILCKVQKSRSWAIRCLHELDSFKGNGSFVTLTYTDEFLPKDGAIDKREFTLAIKRLRKEVEPLRIRYYGCGEYGDDKMRPHYHLIVFGLSPSESREYIKKIWNKGFIYVTTVNYARCRYIAKYIIKNVGEKKELVSRYGDRQPPFQLMSKGLGRDWALKNMDQLQRAYLTMNGHHIGVPRYYKSLMTEMEADEYQTVMQIRDEELYIKNLLQEEKAFIAEDDNARWEIEKRKWDHAARTAEKAANLKKRGF